MKKPFQVGEMVRVYGAVRARQENDWPNKPSVYEFVICRGDTAEIINTSGWRVGLRFVKPLEVYKDTIQRFDFADAHLRQCRRLKAKKKPREFWVVKSVSTKAHYDCLVFRPDPHEWDECIHVREVIDK